MAEAMIHRDHAVRRGQVPQLEGGRVEMRLARERMDWRGGSAG